MHHVATSCSNPQLKVECEWRLGLWDSLTQTIKSTQLAETPANAMVTCYALAISGRQSELAAHLTSAMARLQHEWSLLPPSDINAKVAMLQKANQWVEVSDGAKVVQEIKRCTMNATMVRTHLNASHPVGLQVSCTHWHILSLSAVLVVHQLDHHMLAHRSIHRAIFCFGFG